MAANPFDMSSSKGDDNEDGGDEESGSLLEDACKAFFDAGKAGDWAACADAARDIDSLVDDEGDDADDSGDVMGKAMGKSPGHAALLLMPHKGG